MGAPLDALLGGLQQGPQLGGGALGIEDDVAVEAQGGLQMGLGADAVFGLGFASLCGPGDAHQAARTLQARRLEEFALLDGEDRVLLELLDEGFEHGHRPLMFNSVEGGVGGFEGGFGGGEVDARARLGREPLPQGGLAQHVSGPDPGHFPQAVTDLFGEHVGGDIEGDHPHHPAINGRRQRRRRRHRHRRHHQPAETMETPAPHRHSRIGITTQRCRGSSTPTSRPGERLSVTLTRTFLSSREARASTR